jgi:hypothetical protein
VELLQGFGRGFDSLIAYKMEIDGTLVEFYDEVRGITYMCIFNTVFNTYDLIEYRIDDLWAEPDRKITYPRHHFQNYEKIEHGIKYTDIY